MGPRSCERGNHDGEVIAAKRVLSASMGPRSCERGNPEKGLPGIAIGCCASMGPRSCERGNLRKQPVSVSRLHASMGPRSCERGNGSQARGAPPGAGRLQWGRARASAEIGCGLQKCNKKKLGFNGAALVRARKSEQEPIDSYVLILLQWGRARASAEMRRIGIHIHYPIVASMGPRSCERGNGFHVRATCLLHVQLQWGRARASAEIQTLTRMS